MSKQEMVHDELIEKRKQVGDLSMLVRRLVVRLSKHSPDAIVIKQATEYLQRNNLQGNPLRGS